MALARLNPLRCDGTALPVPLLLMLKVLLLVRLPAPFDKPFEPFLGFLNQLDPAPLTWVTLLATAAIFLNQKVRLASFLLGCVLLLELLSNRATYSNTKTFTALLFFMTGLYEERLGAWLVRLQVVVLYFGAALHKLLERDWQTGVFFHYWAGTSLQRPLYQWAESMLPGLWLAKFFCWTVIGLEFCLAAAFLWRRAWAQAVWASLLFHIAITVFTGQRFFFFYPIQAAMLAFVDWPEGDRRLIYRPWLYMLLAVLVTLPKLVDYPSYRALVLVGPVILYPFLRRVII
jgi:hypothetical protein